MAVVPVCALDDCRKWHHRSAVWQRTPCCNRCGGPGARYRDHSGGAGPSCRKTYTLCGPTELDQAGIAVAITEVLGRKISYQPLTIPRYRERLERAGLPEFMIQHFCTVALEDQNGIFSGEDKIIAELTGKPPCRLSPR
jgi:uncharacterized protein YbjT (DUF2867 family)